MADKVSVPGWANDVLGFILKWLGVGLVLHFGLKLGGLLDRVLTFI